jgi:hypothetical protein
VGAFGLLALLTGCSKDEMLAKFTNDAEQKRALELIDTMRRGDLEVLEPMFHENIRKNPHLREQMDLMRAAMYPGEPDERKLVGVQVNDANGQHQANLTYQFRWGDKYVLTNCATLDEGDKFLIVGMSAHQMAKSLEAQNEFGLTGKTPLQYGVFFYGIAAALFSVFVLVLCVMDRGLRRKWLWILAIIFGVTELSVDWNTGAYVFKPLAIQLFSVGAVAPPYGAWVLSVGLPLGALAYLLARRKLNSSTAVGSNDG